MLTLNHDLLIFICVTLFLQVETHSYTCPNGESVLETCTGFAGYIYSSCRTNVTSSCEVISVASTSYNVSCRATRYTGIFTQCDCNFVRSSSGGESRRLVVDAEATEGAMYVELTVMRKDVNFVTNLFLEQVTLGASILSVNILSVFVGTFFLFFAHFLTTRFVKRKDKQVHAVILPEDISPDTDNSVEFVRKYLEHNFLQRVFKVLDFIFLITCTLFSTLFSFKSPEISIRACL